MLFLFFSIARKRYALQAEQIIEVLPNLTTNKLDPSHDPATPPYFAGRIDYHGQQIPVIDLCQMLNDTSCPNLLSSRIILTKAPFHQQNFEAIGLLAEKVTETIHINVPDDVPLKTLQFKESIEPQFSETHKTVTLFDPLNDLTAPFNKLLHYL